MGWKRENVRSSIAFSISAAVAVTGAILTLARPRVTFAQDDRVAIEPRTARVDTTGTANRVKTDIRVNSSLVLVPVTVTDQQDRVILGLARDQFRVWDDKVEQTISHFAAEDVPISIGLVFDSSGSMGPKLRMSRAAVTQFIKSANPDDEFSLVTFNDQAKMLTGFTKDPGYIQDRLMFIESKGRTALLDGLILSMNEMKNAKHTRKAILLISDGGDNNSRYSVREVKSRLREADVQLYAIGIMEPLAGRTRTMEEMDGPLLLDEIASQTGGRLFEAADVGELPNIATRIGAALRNQYVLGYVPSADNRDGKYHHLQVKISKSKGLPSLRIFSRMGYYATPN
jgi:Ca-activated chloride channel family protein